jgi:phage terminase large subunit-like protein
LTTSPRPGPSVAPPRPARRPRICTYPAYSTSAGDEAIELAASAGLLLDDWQQDVLRASLGERRDGRWSAFEVGVIVSRQNGKGAILEARALAGLLLFGEKLQLWSAHEFKTAAEAFRRVCFLFETSDDLRRRVRRINTATGNEGIELTRAAGGGRLRFVARSKGSGRGFSGDLVILDEAYAVTDDQIEALMPTMSARDNPQLWYTSSPPLSSDTGGHLFRLRRRALPGGPDLAYFDWGAEGELEDLAGIDLDDRALWAATNPAYGIRVSEEFVAKERAAMTPAGFARERLGIWPRDDEDAGALIDPHVWQALAAPEPTSRDAVAFAIDVTPQRDHAAIGVYVPAGESGNVTVIDHRPGTDWLIGRLSELKAQWNPVAIGVDAKGPAGSLLVALEKAGFRIPKGGDEPRYGDLAVAGAQDLAAACGQFVDAVKQGTLSHQGQPELNLAVAGVKTRPLGDAWAWARRTATQDISPLVAVTVARWAYHTRAHLVTDYDVLASVW